MTNKEIVDNAFLDFEIPLGTAKLLEKFGRKVAKATCKQYEGEIEVLKAEIFRLDNLRKDIRIATLKEVYEKRVNPKVRAWDFREWLEAKIKEMEK
jgi:hypothetical protein